MKLSSFLARGVLAAAVAWSLVGCGDSKRAPGAGGGLDKPPIPGKCTIPAEGCPCETDLSVECGETVKRDENTLTCRTGERSCIDGSWSSCAGTKTTQIYSPPPTAPGVGIQAQATDAESCEDECDPYCQTLADTPDESIVVDDDLVVDVTGLTLETDAVTGSNCPDVSITPEMSTLTITQINADGTVVPDNVQLAAMCGVVTISPLWKVAETDRATIDQSGLARVFSAIAGELNVTATSQLDGDTAVVHVVVNVNRNEGADPATFAGAGTAVDPGKTLYPYKETVFPLDLKAPLVQWQTGGVAASQGVQVALRYPAGSATPSFWYSAAYANEPTQGTLHQTGAPAWQIPQEAWTAFGRTAAGATGEIVIQRRAGGTLYNEMIIPVRFASEALRGTVYYTQYLRRLFKTDTPADTTDSDNQCGNSVPDLPANYDPLNPAGFQCCAGNDTHVNGSGSSTTRAIDMSTPTAANLDPFGNQGGCPVCHSVSANGKVYVAGSRFLQRFGNADTDGFVSNINGVASFSERAEAPNYAKLANVDDWDSRGFGYAPLTPDGALALQGFYAWGNTGDGTVANNDVVSRSHSVGGQISPMFFVPTEQPGTSVLLATAAALPSNTISGNDLDATAVGALTVDGIAVATGDSILVKNEANAVKNGIYTVTYRGSPSTPPLQVQNRVIDNDTGTRWESIHGVDPQWIYINLGAVRRIARVQIQWEGASAKNYQLQVSNDTVNWTTISNQVNMANGARTDNITGLNASGQYLRMYGTARTTGFGYSIYEIDVWGDPNNACMACSTTTDLTALTTLPVESVMGTPYKLTRRQDADGDPGTAAANTDIGSMTAGMEVRVRRGSTANYGHVFKLTSPMAGPVTVGTSAITFTDQSSYTPITWPMATPTISPDGTKLAYVTGDEDTVMTDSTAWRKGLTVMDLNQTTRTLTNKKRVLNNWPGAGNGGGKPVKWPFFEGDSKSLIYMESTTDSFCSSENNTSDNGKACIHSVYGNMAPTTRGRWDGLLWSIDTSAPNPSTTKAELTKLNKGEDPEDDDKAYQPTVLPDSIGGYRWVIFTSPRSYGNQLNQKGTHFSCAATTLWVSAIDDAQATATDRSHPAFFLPGQNVAPITTQDHYVNERGYLVRSQCKAPSTTCSTNDECCSGNCSVDSVPAMGAPTRLCKAANYCSPLDGACLEDADCCDGRSCINSMCANDPVYDTAATFDRVYHAECPSGFHPLWGLFLYHLTTPGPGSHILFSARTAAVATDLDMADAVTLRDSTGDNFGQMPETVNVGDELLDDDVSASLPYLRVSMTLYPTSNGALAPILHDWEQRYTCVPAE